MILSRVIFCYTMDRLAVNFLVHPAAFVSGVVYMRHPRPTTFEAHLNPYRQSQVNAPCHCSDQNDIAGPRWQLKLKCYARAASP